VLGRYSEEVEKAGCKGVKEDVTEDTRRAQGIPRAWMTPQSRAEGL